MQTDAVYRGDVDRPTDDFFHLQQFAAEFFVAVQDVLTACVKLGSLSRESKPLLAAVNYQRVEVFFHRFQLLADCRLSDSIHFRRTGKTLAFDEVGEDFEILDMHRLLYNQN